MSIQFVLLPLFVQVLLTFVVMYTLAGRRFGAVRAGALKGPVVDEVARMRCPTLVVIPGAETVGGVANYKPFERLGDVTFRVYDDLPHNICDAVPDRCATDVRDFLRRRFGD